VPFGRAPVPALGCEDQFGVAFCVGLPALAFARRFADTLNPTDLHCACLRINGSMNSGQTTALISKALNFTVYFVSRTMKDCSLDFQEELGR
jgi:hypothetical protein